MNKRTNYGLSLLHSSWIGHEFHTMQILFEAGVDIPKPYVSSDNAILMDYIGDEDTAAPTLNTVPLSSAEARVIFERVIQNVRLMLQHNCVHADLSAYNILYWDGEICLIDFPQAIDPEENHNAFHIFQRDILRVSEYFIARGVKIDAYRLADQLWTERGRRTTPQIDPAFLDADKEEDRLVWQKEKG
jgi:RIO kinase 1